MRVFLTLRPGDTVYYMGRQYLIVGMFSQLLRDDDGQRTIEHFAVLKKIEFASPLTIEQQFYAPVIDVLPSLINNQNDGSEWSYLSQNDTS